FANPFIKYTYFKKRKDVIKLLPKLNKNAILLDAGCSIGTFEETLNDIAFPLYKIIGVDFAPEAIKIARSKTVPNTDFLCKSINNLPFENNLFDCIVMIAVIEHLSNKRKALNELKRTLKEKGQIIITTPNKKNIILKIHNFLLEIASRIISKKEVDKDEYLSRKELTQLLKEDFVIKKSIIRYFIPLSFTVHKRTIGLFPLLPPSLNLKLTKFSTNDENIKVPSILREYFAWTIFVVAEKKAKIND
ncbi:unnamed protein product, partial [marine sediment metagenome]